MELSAYFYGVTADIKNPRVPFSFSERTRQYSSRLRQGGDFTLEIRVKNADINALFAFAILKDGSILVKDNIATTKDKDNRILWYAYGYPLHLLYRNTRGFYLGKRTETENHLYIFCLLPETNKFEVYKAEVNLNLTGEGGFFLWQKVCEGCCYLKKDWEIIVEEKCYEEWPPLAELLEFPSFQKKFEPYIWAKQIPERKA